LKKKKVNKIKGDNMKRATLFWGEKREGV